MYVLVANTLPPHLTDQFYTLLRMNFIKSAYILSTNFRVFNDPSMFLCMFLWWFSNYLNMIETDQNMENLLCVKSVVLTLVHLLILLCE